MTPKLETRLARLEGDAARLETTPDPVITAVWLHAMAITLGGYPLPWQETYRKRGTLDRPSDGLARALGYADEAAMNAAAESDPADWGFRLDLAHTALVERYGGDSQDGHRLVCGALDEVAAAKARGVAYEPQLELARPESGLHRALLHFGVASDALSTMEAA